MNDCANLVLNTWLHLPDSYHTQRSDAVHTSTTLPIQPGLGHDAEFLRMADMTIDISSLAPTEIDLLQCSRLITVFLFSVVLMM